LVGLRGVVAHGFDLLVVGLVSNLGTVSADVQLTGQVVRLGGRLAVAQCGRGGCVGPEDVRRLTATNQTDATAPAEYVLYLEFCGHCVALSDSGRPPVGLTRRTVQGAGGGVNSVRETFSACHP